MDDLEDEQLQCPSVKVEGVAPAWMAKKGVTKACSACSTGGTSATTPAGDSTQGFGLKADGERTKGKVTRRRIKKIRKEMGRRKKKWRRMEGRRRRKGVEEIRENGKVFMRWKRRNTEKMIRKEAKPGKKKQMERGKKEKL